MRHNYIPGSGGKSILCGVLAALWVSCAFAQRGTGELRLSVKDGTGGGVAATVELVNQSTDTRQSVNLPADVRYSFKNLPFGFYRLLVTHQGFTPSSELIEVRSEAPQNHEVTLGIQPIETAVNVLESDTLIDPNRSGAAYYIGSKEIQERQMGRPGQDLIDLVVKQPGWLVEANGVLHPRESEYETQYIVDGFPVQDNRSPSFAPSMEADDVQSMKIYTSGIPAEFGKKLGGVIEVTTDRNASPGFHGLAIAQGGSFDTANGFLSGQYTAGRTTASLSAGGFLTDRYLDPPVQANFTNHGSSTSFTGTLERDFTDSDRLRVSATHRATWFLVPNELIQAAAGQRQDRTSEESSGQVSYQHVFSPTLLGAIRGMVRDVSAQLWSNPLATPISADQDRGFREGYFNGSLSGHWGRHEWKTGGEATFASLREKFGYNIVAYNVAGAAIFDADTPPTFNFNGRAQDREQSAYAQDLIRMGNFTLSAGLRFDHYHLLVDESGFSPRLGLSWHSQPLGLVLHTSYDRTFGTPAFENILVSASAAAMALNDNALYLPLRPSRGNYYEAGLTKAIATKVRLDASYFRRDIRNFADDDLLVNTGVSFPIALHSAQIRGVEAKLEIPRWGRFSGFVSYANTIGIAQFPIAGGLFLDDNSADLLNSNARFPISQDQRNTGRAQIRYQIHPRLWTAWSATYNSGLPIDNLDQDAASLIAQYGSAVVGRVNFDLGRVKPSFSLDASVGADLWRKEKRSVSLQADALNLTNQLNVINFAGLFSGTAIAPPRSFGIRLRTEF
jgi:hypothetical protein